MLQATLPAFFAKHFSKRFFTRGRAAGFSLAILGALLMSIDPLFIRFAGVSGFDTAFLFGLFTAISMPLLIQRVDPRGLITAVKASGWPLLAAALLMLGSSTGLVFSVKTTSIANTFVIFAATPALAALFSWIFLKERASRETWLAIIAVMLGILVVAYGSFNAADSAMHGAGPATHTEVGSAQSAHWLGDVLAMAAVTFLALMMTLLRKYQDVSRLAVVGLGGLLLAVVMVFFATPSEYSSNTWLIMAAMGLFSAPLGRVFTMVATRYISAAEVSMTLMLETVLASLWGVIFFAEIPSAYSLVGGGIILTTILFYTWASMKSENES